MKTCREAFIVQRWLIRSYRTSQILVVGAWRNTGLSRDILHVLQIHDTILSFLLRYLSLLLELQKDLKVVDITRRSGNVCHFFSWIFLSFREKLLCLLSGLLPNFIELLLKIVHWARFRDESIVHVKGVYVLKMGNQVRHLWLARLLLQILALCRLGSSWLTE